MERLTASYWKYCPDMHITQAKQNGNSFRIPRYVPAAAAAVKIPWNFAKQDSSMCH